MVTMLQPVMSKYDSHEAYQFVLRILLSCTAEEHLVGADKLIAFYNRLYGDNDFYFELQDKRTEIYRILHNFLN